MFGQRGYKWGYINRSLKSLDCILHDLLIAKLAAYGFDYQSLRIMESFLCNRQQRTEVNNVFSRYSEIIYRVSQGSILGVLLFNIYICDIFLDIIECDIASYEDDNAPYNFHFNLENVTSNLEQSTNSLLNWFRENHTKANADKCHLLVRSDESCTAKIEYFSIKNSTEEKLLGVNLILIFLLKIMPPLFLKRQARNYTLLPEYYIAWT